MRGIYLVIRVSQWTAVGIVCAVVTRGQAGRTSLSRSLVLYKRTVRALAHTTLYRYLMNVAQGCSPPRTRRVKGGECPLPRLLPPPTPPHADLLLTPWRTTAALPISFLSQPTDLPPDRLSCFDLSVSSGFEEIWSEQIRTSWNC